MIQIAPALTPAELDAVRALWSEYWAELGFTPCFQGFEQELSALPGHYALPRGRILLATVDSQPAGAAAFRPLPGEETTCEGKRLYVAPRFRGLKLGRLLMQRLFEEARASSYTRLVGDTLPVMQSALAMYDRMGFRRIAPYRGSTHECICVEYRLNAD